MTAEPSQYRQEFVQRLDILRTNESFCDVTITAKGKEFKAHRAVLAAASPFFLTLLTSDMRESNEQLIRIELEEATASVMEDVLKYIYTGNVSITEERAHNLIATADYLLLPSLKTMVGTFLKEIITVQNCIFNYYFSEKYKCIQLKEKAREVINANFSAVMETEDFKKLDVKQLIEWVSSDDVIVNAEEEVFKGIVKWVSHNKSEREGHFPELLHQVRLKSVSHDFLINQLVKEELLTKDTEFCLNFVLDAMKLLLCGTDGQVNQQPRECLETHTDGIFVCGGRKALCYLPQKNMWYKLEDPPFHYQSHTLTQHRSRVYVFDNETHELGESEVTEYYEPDANSWGAIQSGMVNTFTSCTVLNGKLYASYFSYFKGAGVSRYDEQKNCWDEIVAPPTGQEDPCVVADEKFLYVIGGRKNSDALSTTIRFDPRDNQWEEVADINEGRFMAFGVAMNRKVFIAGGRQTKWTVITSCEVYDPSTSEWQLMPSLKVPRFSASMVFCKKRLYVMGGTTLTQQSKPIRALSIEEFDPERNEWKKKSAIPVKSFETSEQKNKNHFQACFARLYKKVIDKLEPLN